MLLFLSFPALADAPSELVHTGRLLDSGGLPLTGSLSVDIALYTDPTGGSMVWSDSKTVDFDDGYFTVRLGDDAINAPLTVSQLDQSQLYIELSPNGTALPRQRVVSVPYAMVANTAVNVDGGVVNASEIQIDGQVVIDSSGVQDTLSSLSCVADQVALYDGTDWTCSTPSTFSGSYNDLTDLPTLFSGDYADLTNTPTLFSGDYADLTNTPTLFSGDYNDLTSLPTLFSGDYNDLTSLPTLFSGDYNDLSSLPTLSTVAGSGDFADLLSIPPGLLDGDDVLTESEVETFVTNGPIAFSDTVQVGDSGSGSCGNSDAGTLRWSAGQLHVCDGSEWRYAELFGSDNGQFASGPGLHCADIHARFPSMPSGTYWVDPDGSAGNPAFEVWCDMDTDGGGWTLVYGHDYTDTDRTQLQTSLAQMITDFVTPGPPEPGVNFRVPLERWNSLGPSTEMLFFAGDKRAGPNTTPDDLWIKQTDVALDPGNSYAITHGGSSTVSASHTCLNPEMMATHSVGPVWTGQGGAPGQWQAPAHCSGDGVPYPTISCWCLSLGNSSGQITPTGCGSAGEAGNLFYDSVDGAPQQCSADQSGMASSAYGAVGLMVR